MHELMRRFSVIHRQSAMYLDRRLRAHRMTASQYTYILVICENPGISQEEISGRLKIDKGSVARAMKQFEETDYVVRRASPADRRQYEIRPTQRALTAYADIQKIAADSEERLTRGFTPIEREVLIAILDKVLANIDESGAKNGE